MTLQVTAYNFTCKRKSRQLALLGKLYVYKTQRAPTLSKSLSPVHVVALSLGSIIGWMAFVMPGTDFLPKAGPLGVSLAFGVASLAMILIALNYGYMVNRHPVAGGEFSFASFAFGKYHAFFCA